MDGRDSSYGPNVQRRCPARSGGCATDQVDPPMLTLFVHADQYQVLVFPTLLSSPFPPPSPLLPVYAFDGRLDLDSDQILAV